MKEITTAEMQQKLENGETLHMIDVREADEVATGIIPGAIHIPLGEIPERLGNSINLRHMYSFAVQAAVADVLQNFWKHKAMTRQIW